MLNKRRFIFLLAFISPMAMAQPDSHLPGSLVNIIQLQEKNENGEKHSLAFGAPPQDVDINSVIEIKISKEQLLEGQPYKSSSPLRPEHQALLDAANYLNACITKINERIALSIQLGQISDRASEPYTKLAQQIQPIHRAIAGSLMSYRQFLVNQNGNAMANRASELSKKLKTAVEEDGEQSFVPIIKDEIQWLIHELEQAGQQIIRESDPIAIGLIAYYVPADQTNLTPPKSDIHLEHYDALEPGVPQPIDKLNVIPSPEQTQKLKEAYSKTKEIATNLNELKDGREQLKVLLNAELTQHGIDITEVINSAKALQQNLDKLRQTDWEAELKALQGKVEAVLSDNPNAGKKQKLLTIKAQLKQLKIKIGILSQDTNKLKQLISDLSPRFNKASIAGKSDPVEALLALMEEIAATKSAFGEITKSIQALNDDTQSFVSDAGEVLNELPSLLTNIDGLDEDTKSSLKSVIADAFQSTLSPTNDSATNLVGSVKKVLITLTSLSTDAKNDLDLYATTDITPPDTSYIIPLAQAKDTWLDLNEIGKNRAENGKIVLQASLYHLNQENGQYVPFKQPIDKETQSFRILQYGWYGKYSVGLAYVSADNIATGQNQSISQRGFAPQVSWIARHRGWHDKDGFSQSVTQWYENIGIGIHSIALDLNKDNQQEIGLGITISLFDELFQVGYGVDLSNNQKYSFIATRLFSF